MNKELRVGVMLSGQELDTLVWLLNNKANEIGRTAETTDEDAWNTYREMTDLQARLRRNRNTALALSI